MDLLELFKSNGPLISTAGLSIAQCTDLEVQFHHREKGEIALTVGSSWYGGDYFEFGSHDLNTFRNMLSAYKLSGMCRAYPDVQFYAFDIFGKLDAMADPELKAYFAPYSGQGDQLAHHQSMVVGHGLFVDQCHLVQGLFKDMLTPEFKTSYGDRKIGFACIDCNVAYSYKTVFDFIFDMMAENSYIYLDEGLQSPDVLALYTAFVERLRAERNMDSVYIRNAGGFGSLYRLFPIVKP